jgi:predicted TIM-barrel fold metal-dependent hydrolase
MMGATSRLIVGAPVHVWAADSPERPWPAGAQKPHRPVPFTRSDLDREMRAAGVARVVLVPPSWEGNRNDLALAAAAAEPERFAVAGRLSLLDPAAGRPAIRDWLAIPGMRALRFTCMREPDRTALRGGAAGWVWPAAEAAGVPVMIYAPGSTAVVGAIAARHPGLRLAIDHLGLSHPARREGTLLADLSELLALARLPNVAVKASALPAYATDPYPYRGFDEPLRRIFEAFGPRRMFWGTDLTQLPCSYSEAIESFARLPWMSETDRDWVMGRSVSEWLDWPLPAAARGDARGGALA